MTDARMLEKYWPWIVMVVALTAISAVTAFLYFDQYTAGSAVIWIVVSFLSWTVLVLAALAILKLFTFLKRRNKEAIELPPFRSSVRIKAPSASSEIESDKDPA